MKDSISELNSKIEEKKRKIEEAEAQRKEDEEKKQKKSEAKKEKEDIPVEYVDLDDEKEKEMIPIKEKGIKIAQKVKRNGVFKFVYNILDKLADRIVPKEDEEEKADKKKENTEEEEIRKAFEEGDYEYKSDLEEKSGKIVDFKGKSESKAFRDGNKVDIKPEDSQSIKKEVEKVNKKEKGEDEPEK